MRFTRVTGCLCALALMVSLTGCDKEAPPPDVEARKEPDFAGRRASSGDSGGYHGYGAAEEREALPPGHPPLGAGEGLPPGHPPMTPEPLTGRGLTFNAPEAWEETPPRNTMIRKSYRLPKVEGDAEDAVLEITHFPEMGHVTFQMQADRWAGSFQQSDGRAGTAAAVQKEVEGAAFPTMLLDVSGRYQASTMMGQARGEPKDNYRKLAAEIRSDEGPWFVKLIGPAETVGHWEEEFLKFIREAK